MFISSTVAIEGVPATTPAGRLPNPSSTLSPSSSTWSSYAMTMKDFWVSPEAKVTLEGTPVQSALVAPFIPVEVIGTTISSGAGLSSLTTIRAPTPPS